MNNKTDIEEDIKIVNEILLHNKETKEVRQAIENILADRERLEKENKQLRINEINSLCEECSKVAKEANWTKEDTNRVITEYREMEAKANKYDTLVEKIKDIIKNKYIAMFEGNAEFADNATRMEIVKYVKETDLQELLDTENDGYKRRLEELG